MNRNMRRKEHTCCQHGAHAHLLLQSLRLRRLFSDAPHSLVVLSERLPKKVVSRAMSSGGRSCVEAVWCALRRRTVRNVY